MSLEHALRLSPEEVIAGLQTAGIRQKGGAGRPVAPRWQWCRDAGGADKLVICNAVDADPRAPIARFVLANKMEAVLGGLCIAAHAVGATRAAVCVNADYADEIAELKQAVRAVAAASCEIRVEVIPGSLVTAQETALIRALEGRQPLPYLRPEYEVAGMGGAPTLAETAETLAEVWALFAGQTTDTGVDSKVVAVIGDVTHAGAFEVPLGTTVTAAIERAEGRPLGELAVKAVQLGGPATRFLAGDTLQTAVAHEALEQAGLQMGSGSIEVFGGRRCAVEMARDVTAHLHEESCGMCVFCREGTRQLLEMLDDLVDYRADAEKMDLLLELARALKAGSICSLGWGAADPVLSALELFAADFSSHLERKTCPEKT